MQNFFFLLAILKSAIIGGDLQNTNTSVSVKTDVLNWKNISGTRLLSSSLKQKALW